MGFEFFVYYGSTPIAASLFYKDAKKILKRKKKRALIPNSYTLRDIAGSIIS